MSVGCLRFKHSCTLFGKKRERKKTLLRDRGKLDELPLGQVAISCAYHLERREMDL